MYGNPGRGALGFLPAAKREYTALELTAQTYGNRRLNVLASYVLSRSSGNYSGLWDSGLRAGFPNALFLFDDPQMLVNAQGLMPNDRTHVLKLVGSYRMPFGLTAGTSFMWSSGTPLSELGSARAGWYQQIFLQPRGTVGRTSSIWDLNLRFVYDASRLTRTSWSPRLILDIFHIGSPREAVDFEQQHFLSQDDQGNQTDPNPLFGEPIRFQPPMTFRLGLEVNF
jgi:hypothetical protein